MRNIWDWFSNQKPAQMEPGPLVASQPSWDPAPLSHLVSSLHEDPLLRPFLGIGECKALMHTLLHHGLGQESPAELEQLLAKLLVKNAKDSASTSQCLDSFFQSRSKALESQLESLVRTMEAQMASEKAALAETGGKTPVPPPPSPPKPPATGDTQRSAQTREVYETSVQVELTLRPSNQALPAGKDTKSAEKAGAAQPPQGHRFILTDDYHPLSRRQMDQIWRFLRKPSRTGGRAENMDLPRTVERFARQGWLDQPEWQRDKINKVHLVLLIDQSSSMVAWNSFGRHLIAAARQGGGHRNAEVFWFANLPQQFVSADKPGVLFKDATRFKSEKIEKLLRRCSKQDTEVLIFSDGGAARGGMNEDRAKATKAWLQLLKKHVSSIAWLNPMPRRRWGGSTASWIQHEVAMFEPDQHGLMGAINHLRGR